MADERAVSEVLGFVLVASLILSTIGVVYVAGMGGLEAARDGERVQNAERAFDVLADNVEDLRARGAPSRATEIKLADAQLDYGEPTRISVNVTNTTDGTSVNVSKDVDPIRYGASSDARLVYENGAVVRVDRGSAVMKVPPSFVFLDRGPSTRTAVIPLMQTRQTGPGSVGGSSTVLVRTETAVREVLVAERATTYHVNFTMQTTEPRAAVWADYFNRSSTIPDDLHQTPSDPTCDLVGDRVTCSLAVERVTVTRVGVDVRFT